MPGVLPARVAELRSLQPLGMLLLVLGGRVVPVFALGALQCDDLSHVSILSGLSQRFGLSHGEVQGEYVLPADKQHLFPILPHHSNP